MQNYFFVQGCLPRGMKGLVEFGILFQLSGPNIIYINEKF